MEKIGKTLCFCAFITIVTSQNPIVFAQIDQIDKYLPDLSIDSGKSTLYKSSIKLLQNEFSGILIIKNMGNLQYRFVFTTETGIKLFDYQIYKQKINVIYGLGPLKNRAITKHLGENLKMLLPADSHFTNYKLVKNEDYYLLSVKIKKNNYQYRTLKGENLISYQFTKKKKLKLSADYFIKNKASNIPWKVAARNHNFQLQGNYQRIKDM